VSDPTPSRTEPRSVLDPQQLDAFERDGFVRLAGFADPSTGHAMLDRVIELARRAAGGEDISPAFVLPEQQADLAARARAGARPEDLVSKVFGLARDPVFHEFATSDVITDRVAQILGTDDVDVFLSQFIFKNAGAWGQPWHQDSYYFPFDPPRPVVGVWLAISEATRANGCLHVLPGSHREPVKTHVDDRRPNANYGYVEIVDHDMTGSVPVLMQPGDLLLFDSHLMHRSTDNETDGVRAAMVFHYARAGTHDRTEQLKGYTVNDWLPARRGPAPDLISQESR
jgi:phytanoyl-CoA hydroxylase